ncbi:MAG: preprotein translocase subunit Sec61beta [Thermoprotei archaeon]
MAKGKKKSKSRGGRRERASGPFTAAGLIRFYEEADIGIKMKPYTLIILIVVFTAIVIILSKLYGG